MRGIDSADAVLVSQAQGGSSDAAAELFRRHWPGAWRAALAVCGSGAVADDMAQDAFERAFAALASLNGRQAFGPWVQRIAINRAIDHLRRERRLGALPDDLEDPVEWAGAGVGDPAIIAAVAALPPERRLPVLLRYWFDYTPAEIADALRLPLGTVSSRLARALGELRLTLGADDA